MLRPDSDWMQFMFPFSHTCYDQTQTECNSCFHYPTHVTTRLGLNAIHVSIIPHMLRPDTDWMQFMFPLSHTCYDQTRTECNSCFHSPTHVTTRLGLNAIHVSIIPHMLRPDSDWMQFMFPLSHTCYDQTQTECNSCIHYPTHVTTRHRLNAIHVSILPHMLRPDTDWMQVMFPLSHTCYDQTQTECNSCFHYPTHVTTRLRLNAIHVSIIPHMLRPDSDWMQFMFPLSHTCYDQTQTECNSCFHYPTHVTTRLGLNAIHVSIIPHMLRPDSDWMQFMFPLSHTCYDQTRTECNSCFHSPTHVTTRHRLNAIHVSIIPHMLRPDSDWMQFMFPLSHTCYDQTQTECNSCFHYPTHVTTRLGLNAIHVSILPHMLRPDSDWMQFMFPLSHTCYDQTQTECNSCFHYPTHVTTRHRLNAIHVSIIPHMLRPDTDWMQFMFPFSHTCYDQTQTECKSCFHDPTHVTTRLRLNAIHVSIIPHMLRPDSDWMQFMFPLSHTCYDQTRTECNSCFHSPTHVTTRHRLNAIHVSIIPHMLRPDSDWMQFMFPLSHTCYDQTQTECNSCFHYPTHVTTRLGLNAIHVSILPHMLRPDSDWMQFMFPLSHTCYDQTQTECNSCFHYPTHVTTRHRLNAIHVSIIPHMLRPDTDWMQFMFPFSHTCYDQTQTECKSCFHYPTHVTTRLRLNAIHVSIIPHMLRPDSDWMQFMFPLSHTCYDQTRTECNSCFHYPTHVTTRLRLNAIHVSIIPHMLRPDTDWMQFKFPLSHTCYDQTQTECNSCFHYPTHVTTRLGLNAIHVSIIPHMLRPDSDWMQFMFPLSHTCYDQTQTECNSCFHSPTHVTTRHRLNAIHVPIIPHMLRPDTDWMQFMFPLFHTCYDQTQTECNSCFHYPTHVTTRLRLNAIHVSIIPHMLRPDTDWMQFMFPLFHTCYDKTQTECNSCFHYPTHVTTRLRLNAIHVSIIPHMLRPDSDWMQFMFPLSHTCDDQTQTECNSCFHYPTHVTTRLRLNAIHVSIIPHMLRPDSDWMQFMFPLSHTCYDQTQTECNSCFHYPTHVTTRLGLNAIHVSIIPHMLRPDTDWMQFKFPLSHTCYDQTQTECNSCFHYPTHVTTRLGLNAIHVSIIPHMLRPDSDWMQFMFPLSHTCYDQTQTECNSCFHSPTHVTTRHRLNAIHVSIIPHMLRPDSDWMQFMFPLSHTCYDQTQTECNSCFHYPTHVTTRLRLNAIHVSIIPHMLRPDSDWMQFMFPLSHTCYDQTRTECNSCFHYPTHVTTRHRLNAIHVSIIPHMLRPDSDWMQFMFPLSHTCYDQTQTECNSSFHYPTHVTTRHRLNAIHVSIIPHMLRPDSDWMQFMFPLSHTCYDQTQTECNSCFHYPTHVTTRHRLNAIHVSILPHMLRPDTDWMQFMFPLSHTCYDQTQTECNSCFHYSTHVTTRHRLNAIHVSIIPHMLRPDLDWMQFMFPLFHTCYDQTQTECNSCFHYPTHVTTRLRLNAIHVSIIPHMLRPDSDWMQFMFPLFHTCYDQTQTECNSCFHYPTHVTTRLKLNAIHVSIIPHMLRPDSDWMQFMFPLSHTCYDQTQTECNSCFHYPTHVTTRHRLNAIHVSIIPHMLRPDSDWMQFMFPLSHTCYDQTQTECNSCFHYSTHVTTRHRLNAIHVSIIPHMLGPDSDWMQFMFPLSHTCYDQKQT